MSAYSSTADNGDQSNEQVLVHYSIFRQHNLEDVLFVTCYLKYRNDRYVDLQTVQDSRIVVDVNKWTERIQSEHFNDELRHKARVLLEEAEFWAKRSAYSTYFEDAARQGMQMMAQKYFGTEAYEFDYNETMEEADQTMGRICDNFGYAAVATLHASEESVRKLEVPEISGWGEDKLYSMHQEGKPVTLLCNLQKCFSDDASTPDCFSLTLSFKYNNASNTDDRRRARTRLRALLPGHEWGERPPVDEMYEQDRKRANAS